MSEEASRKTPDGEMAPNEEPYDWDRCTVKLSVLILPCDGEDGGRPILLGSTTHHDPPLYESARLLGLAGLPSVIKDLFNRLKQRLPELGKIAESRRQAEMEAEENRKLERERIREQIQAARQKTSTKDGHSSQAERTDKTDPVSGKQSSLF